MRDVLSSTHHSLLITHHFFGTGERSLSFASHATASSAYGKPAGSSGEPAASNFNPAARSAVATSRHDTGQREARDLKSESTPPMRSRSSSESICARRLVASDLTCSSADSSYMRRYISRASCRLPPRACICAAIAPIHAGDRKSVVKGKSVDLGGRRIIKKKN